MDCIHMTAEMAANCRTCNPHPMTPAQTDVEHPMRNQLIAILDRDRKWPDAAETADAILAALPAMIEAGIPDLVWISSTYGQISYSAGVRYFLEQSQIGLSVSVKEGENFSIIYRGKSNEAAKAAANAHNRATLMAAIGMGVE